MASTSETGHAKNVANFSILITSCASYGAKYNPSNANLVLANLNSIYANADAIIDSLNTAEEAYTSALGARRAEFETLKPFATRLLNAYLATNTTKEKKATAKSINVKLQGQKVTNVKQQLAKAAAKNTASDGAAT